MTTDPQESALMQAVVEAAMRDTNFKLANFTGNALDEACQALADYRAKSSSPEPARCEPPEEHRDVRWHWLVNGEPCREHRPVCWYEGKWHLAIWSTPEEVAGLRWAYVGPCLPDTRPSDELEKEEASHLRTIAERDHREEQIVAIYHTLGGENEWSNLHDLGDEALELAQELMLPDSRIQPTDEAIRAFLDNHNWRDAGPSLDALVRAAIVHFSPTQTITPVEPAFDQRDGTYGVAVDQRHLGPTIVCAPTKRAKPSPPELSNEQIMAVADEALKHPLWSGPAESKARVVSDAGIIRFGRALAAKFAHSNPGTSQ